MNSFDLLVIIILLIGIVIGALHGAARQLMGLFSAWLGLVICMWLYIPFSQRILKGLLLKLSPDNNLNDAVINTIGFFILIILFAIIFQAIFLYTSKSPEQKRDNTGQNFAEKARKKNNISVLNLFGGLVTGFITTAVWLSLIMSPVQYALFSIRSTGAVQNAIATSALLPYFELVLWYIYQSIRFFIPPTGLPAVFSLALGS